MNRPKKLLVGRRLVRAVLLVLALVPFIYWQPFYVHFYTYLTGTIIAGIIKSQWQLVIFSILLFMVFVIPLTYRKPVKWLDYGLISAFFISLFVEMYGIPLTILLASKYLFVPGIKLPADVVEFNFLGVGIGMDHAMLFGAVLIIFGMGLIIFGWRSLFEQSKNNNFAQKGLYTISRHPQYLGFILLVLGWFFGWPTILTLFFSPVLIYKYVKAAQAEEKGLTERFGIAYQEYKKKTPFLI